MNNPKYTQGTCEDGAAILRDGQPMTIEEIPDALRDSEKLQAEVERLREELSAQKVITESYMYGCDRYKEMTGERLETLADVEKECDQLKAAVAMAIDAFKRYDMDVETYPTIEHVSMMRNLEGALAQHNAKVIDRAINECAYKTLEGDIINVECIREYANQLRQQAKEVLDANADGS